jgi:hypothetical protein
LSDLIYYGSVYATYVVKTLVVDFWSVFFFVFTTSPMPLTVPKLWCLYKCSLSDCWHLQGQLGTLFVIYLPPSNPFISLRHTLLVTTNLAQSCPTCNQTACRLHHCRKLTTIQWICVCKVFHNKVQCGRRFPWISALWDRFSYSIISFRLQMNAVALCLFSSKLHFLSLISILLIELHYLFIYSNEKKIRCL